MNEAIVCCKNIWRILYRVSCSFGELIKAFLFKPVFNDIDVVLICHDNDRGLTLSGKAYSPLLDSLREELECAGLACLSVTYPFCKFYGERAYGDVVSSTRYYLFGYLYKKISKFLPAMKSSANPYVALIRDANPSLIVSIGAPPDLSQAARNENVMHAELLHGIGYTFIPFGWNNYKPHLLPQVIFSLDSTSTKTLSPLKDHGVKIFNIPHPFLKKFLANSSFSIPSEWLWDQNSSTDCLKHVLISLQWGYAQEPGSPQCLAGILDNGLIPHDLLDLIKEKPDIYWHIRLHPVQIRSSIYKKTRDFIDNLCKSVQNAEWLKSSTIPLPSLAKICDIHITMSSMTSYDVAYFGIPTLAMCPTLQNSGEYHQLFSDLVLEGYLSKVLPGKTEINSWINKSSRLNPRHLMDENTDSLMIVLKNILKSGNSNSRLNDQ